MSSVYRTTVIPHDPQEAIINKVSEHLSQAVSYGIDNSAVWDWVEVEEVIQDSLGDYEVVEQVLSFRREKDL
jgi:hypothetical protein